MNWDNVDWDNFNCVNMQRQIRSKIAKERANMSIVEYLRKKRTSESYSENSGTLTNELYVSEKTEKYVGTDTL